MNHFTKFSRIILALTFICSGLHSLNAAEVDPKSVTVPKILKVTHQIQKSNPPNLVLKVVGEVPTGGYTDAKLFRVIYKKVPQDGIQDFILKAVPPAGLSTTVVSQVTASKTWKGFPDWVKGIRVHGIKAGVVLIKFNSDDQQSQPVRRRFTGTSKEGSFEKALAEALAKLNKALPVGGVNDATATWRIVRTSGQVGGIAGQNELSVIISAERQPPWPQRKRSPKTRSKKKRSNQ